MADKPKPIAGKGDNRRQEDFKKIQNNWDEIPNFGYKPKWMRETEAPKMERIVRYPDHAKELAQALSEEVQNWNDESQISISTPNKKLQKLLNKYDLDINGKTMYIWEVIEKMHDFRPF